MEIDINLLQDMTQRLSVLFVEDDDDLRLQTQDLLETLFQEVITASNGKEGLEKYLEYHQKYNSNINLVISDIMMPKMSGIDMARKMAQLNKSQQFIFISAHQDSDYLIDLIDIGITSFISKPITLDTLKFALYKNCLLFEGGTLQKELLYKVVEENDRLKKEIVQLKNKQ